MWEFPEIRGTLFGVLIIRILLFRVLYWGPLFSESPMECLRFRVGGVLELLGLLGFRPELQLLDSRSSLRRCSVGVSRTAYVFFGLFFISAYFFPVSILFSCLSYQNIFFSSALPTSVSKGTKHRSSPGPKACSND